MQFLAECKTEKTHFVVDNAGLLLNTKSFNIFSYLLAVLHSENQDEQNLHALNEIHTVISCVGLIGCIIINIAKLCLY